MESIFTLKDKTILITGASSGIGRAIAIECSKQGANIIISGRNQERLYETYSELYGENHKYIIADLVNETEIISLVESLPKLNGVVHCAGIIKKSPIKFLSENKIDEVMKPNFYAPALVMQSLIKQKKILKQSSVVMISSIGSTYATISFAAYAASKGALNSLIRILALELASQKIRVNGIQPGMVLTEMLNVYNPDEIKEIENTYPLGRLGKPEDVAYATVFLLSDASSWITGSSLILDGGLTLR
jgi:NAD(P)-dependent dehydrogenase (short-subunit alcohol dehydrogenase family)